MKNFITAMLFMFMIGMVIDISPQSVAPPDQEQAEVQNHVDIQTVTPHQNEFGVCAEIHLFQLISQFIPELAISAMENGKPEKDIMANQISKQNHLNKHYDPGSCGSCLFS